MTFLRDALKSCDVIFCCTDDQVGRVFLNRLAYFNLIPVFDMGLAMAFAKPPARGIADISARVTTVIPPEACLICRGAVGLDVAREEDLLRQNPTRIRPAQARGLRPRRPSVHLHLLSQDWVPQILPLRSPARKCGGECVRRGQGNIKPIDL